MIIISILLKTCYNGFGRGILAEFLNLIGVVSVTALACNLHGTVAQWLAPWWGFDPAALNFTVFVVLLLGGVVLVHLVLRRLSDLLKWERLHWTIQGVGLVLGGVRGLWWSGLTLLMLLSLGVPYLDTSVQQESVLGPHFVQVAQQSLEVVADRYPGRHAREVLIPQIKLPVPTFFNERPGR